MKLLSAAALVLTFGTSTFAAPIPENLVAEGIPEIPAELRARAERYLDFRSASFQSWHPERREILISTRFANTPQLHSVKFPGGARKQLTFLREPVLSAAYQPKSGNYILFTQDSGGGEFFQVYRYDLADGRITLLTDGKSRNTSARWSRSGKFSSFSSTKRNGKDTDIYVMNPEDPGSARLVMEVVGGGWSAADWSEDDKQLLVMEYVSANESYLHLLDLNTGAKQLLTPKTAEKSAYSDPQFGKKAIFATTDHGSEFQRLIRWEIPKKGDDGVPREFEILTEDINADVESFDVSPDGEKIAFTTNEDGVSVLRILNARTGKSLFKPELPKGVIGGLKWHENGNDLGFTFASARSAGDAYSLSLKSRKIERWTESETSGLDAGKFSEPELVKMKSFDGLDVSAFIYSPDVTKYPPTSGRRPVLVLIHGGPESQSRPNFLARMNYFINEMGIALVVPNVRGSSGYGKTFLTLDNGFKREDTVKDIGTILSWIGAEPRFDKDRIAVMGGSYGGYMVLASMIHHADRLKAGIDMVGISNFLTFLKNTQDYRRDLRRAEYGDERDPQMREFLERISPSSRAKEIRDPLFVIQGQNDPRVPVTESEQMVKAVRENGGQVWYLKAKDEGHGFQKKANQDFQFLTTILFLEKNL